MRHDELCESGSTLSPISGSFGPSRGCKCASRAYKADPLPDDVTPIWTPVWASVETPVRFIDMAGG